MAKAWLILIIAAALVPFAVFLSALLRANGTTEQDDEEQRKYIERWNEAHHHR